MTATLSPARPTFNWKIAGFFGAFHVLALFAPWCFNWPAVAVAIFLHWLFGSIGICLGYHRLLSHRSLRVSRWLEYTLATLGALAMQGGPVFWVAGHRLHHAWTEDLDKDPYCAKRGFWYSHMLWMLYPGSDFFNLASYSRNAPELARDPFYRWLDRYGLTLQIPLAFLLWGLGGWSFLVWGLGVRAVCLWHTTWLINSATHVWGYRSFDVPDNSRNLWWAALLTYGEGWHNNHHAQPNVAPAGRRWWELDMTWWAIRLLGWLGLARNIVLPPVANSKLD
jgi:sn-2 palmitoyl-lipid 9-desaturase